LFRRSGLQHALVARTLKACHIGTRRVGPDRFAGMKLGTLAHSVAFCFAVQ
jgi:hypothetical protein